MSSPPPRTYLDLIKICDNFADIDIPKTPYAEPPGHVFYQLLLPNDPRPHGFLLPDIVAKMPWTADFKVSAADARPRTVEVLDFSNGQNTRDAVNAALADVVQKAVEAGTFASLTRWRSTEDFRIPGARYPYIRLRRAAAGLFGIASLGAHMTMYTRTPEGEIKIWVPRRSAHLSTYPGKLDSTVAGGIRADESPFECILHEAEEEASIPKYLVQQLAKPCGAITYIFTSDPGAGQEHGIMAPVVLYVYDMEVDHTVTPKPQDDEVQEFCLWDVQQIKEAMFRGEFKTNCASVMIDFFIRHGIITDDNEPDYLEILTRLHRPLPVPTSAR